CRTPPARPRVRAGPAGRGRAGRDPAARPQRFSAPRPPFPPPAPGSRRPRGAAGRPGGAGDHLRPEGSNWGIPSFRLKLDIPLGSGKRRILELLGQELAVEELRVEAVAGDQLGVRSLLDDPTLIQHEDP